MVIIRSADTGANDGAGHSRPEGIGVFPERRPAVWAKGARASIRLSRSTPRFFIGYATGRGLRLVKGAEDVGEEFISCDGTCCGAFDLRCPRNRQAAFLPVADSHRDHAKSPGESGLGAKVMNCTVESVHELRYKRAVDTVNSVSIPNSHEIINNQFMSKGPKGYLEVFTTLERIRSERGVPSQRQFAQQYLHVSEQTYWNWSKRGVPAQAVIDCADRLRVSVDSLLGRATVEFYGDHPALPGPDTVARYPLLGTVPAGNFREAVEAAATDSATKWLESPKKLPDGGFFLRVSGPSMNPTLSDGDVILVDPTATPIHRSVVVVRNGSGEATVKRLIQDGESWVLVPDNPQFQAKPLGNCEIVGVVVYAQRDLTAQ